MNTGALCNATAPGQPDDGTERRDQQPNDKPYQPKR